MNEPKPDFENATTHRDDQSKNLRLLDEELGKDIDGLFVRISSLSISDTETDEGLKEVIVAFRQFLIQQECWNALVNFEELLIEKGKNNEFGIDNSLRNNRRTPNILHEIRNCMQSLGMVASGKYDIDEYQKHGGIDADMTARLRHDSLEDWAKTQQELYFKMQKNLNRLYNWGVIDEGTYNLKLLEAQMAAEAIEFMSSKHVKFDSDTGLPVWKDKEKGKFEKVKKFPIATNRYFYELQENIISLLGKYADRIENVATRLGNSGFSVQSNRTYSRKTRETYGLEDFQGKSIDMHPGFEDAIRASDAMLGLQVKVLECMNKYMSDDSYAPEYGDPINIKLYMPLALEAYQDLPPSMHPVSIMIDNLRIEAGDDMRLHAVIDRLIIPPIQETIKENDLKPIQGINHFLYPHCPANDIPFGLHRG